MAITITVGNSMSQVTGLTSEQHRGLRKVLSYDTASYATAVAFYPRNTIRYLIDAKGNFATGLLPRVKAHLRDHQVLDVDTRRNPLSKKPWYIRLNGFTAYEDQRDAVIAAIAEHRGIISMPTGSGKSMVMVLLAQSLGLRTLVVVPNLELKSQLQETFNRWLPTADVVIENIDSKRLKTLKGFDVLMIDEAHHSAAKTYQDLNKTAWAGIYYRYFFTATPFRNNPEEEMLFEGIAGKLIHCITFKQATAKGYIVPVEAYYIDLPKRGAKGTTWAQVYSEIVVNNEYRNKRISEVMAALQGINQPVLCLVKEVAHGALLERLTGSPFVNGQDEESRDYIRQFNAGNLISLIGTTGVIGEGVDTKPCEWVIIAGLGKAKSAFLQQVGRAVRTSPGKTSAKILLIRDASHKWSLAHFNAQVKILREELGVEIIKLDL